MNTQIKWMNRQAMIIRGTRVLEAHWRNRLEGDALDVWFKRHLSRYAAYTSTKVGKPTDMQRLQDRFWLDAEKHILAH